MKRTGFTKKNTKPINKRSLLKKEGKQKISTIQKKLWLLCKEIIRKKYGNTCYTCGRIGLEGSNWHTGHLIPKASVGAYLKYDIRILRPQCYNCNINLGGHGALFIENMRRIEGDIYVDRIIEDRILTVKAYDHYVKLIKEYSKII